MATKFYLDKRADKSGDCPIRVSVTMSGERLLTTAGYSIAPEKWNDKRNEVKKGCSNSKGITGSVINARLRKIESHFVEYENKCADPNPDLRKEFNAYFGSGRNPARETDPTLFDRIDEFVSENGKLNDWTKGTYFKFSAMKKHLAGFKQDIKFSDLNEKGLANLVEYLYDLGMVNTTIKKELSFVKWFLRWATAKGYNKETAFLTFKPNIKTCAKTIVFLDLNELMKVYNFPIPEGKNYLARVRDVFCFCCFTSLRYSDVANLKRSNVFPDHISVTTIKTHDKLTIELNKYSRAILDKYAGETFPKDLALPVITNQKMNVYLKELGKLCGIDKPTTMTYYRGSERIEETRPKYELLGTHAGRRTFVCISAGLGISEASVMKWTGHSNFNGLKPYFDIADSAKKDAMKLWDSLDK